MAPLHLARALATGVGLALLLGVAWYLACAHPWLSMAPRAPPDALPFLASQCFPRVALRPRAARTWCLIRIRGVLVACSSVIEYPHHFEYTNDCVHKDHRRRGLGARMHRARLRHCRRRAPHKRVEVHVDADNAPAHGLTRTLPELARRESGPRGVVVYEA